MTTESPYEEKSQGQETVPIINPYNYQSSDLVRLALNSSDLMEDLRIHLLSLEFDPEKETFVSKTNSKPLIREEGARRIITIVSSIVNRNTNLSNISSEEINTIVKEIELNINDNFFDNWHIYWDNEWEAESNWKIVRSLAGNFSKLALLRAQDGGERDLLGGNTRTLIQKSEVDTSQRITQNPSNKFPFAKIFK